MKQGKSDHQVLLTARINLCYVKVVANHDTKVSIIYADYHVYVMIVSTYISHFSISKVKFKTEIVSQLTNSWEFKD